LAGKIYDKRKIEKAQKNIHKSQNKENYENKKSNQHSSQKISDINARRSFDKRQQEYIEKSKEKRKIQNEKEVLKECNYQFKPQIDNMSKILVENSRIKQKESNNSNICNDSKAIKNNISSNNKLRREYQNIPKIKRTKTTTNRNSKKIFERLSSFVDIYKSKMELLTRDNPKNADCTFTPRLDSKKNKMLAANSKNRINSIYHNRNYASSENLYSFKPAISDKSKIIAQRMVPSNRRILEKAKGKENIENNPSFRPEINDKSKKLIESKFKECGKSNAKSKDKCLELFNLAKYCQAQRDQLHLQRLKEINEIGPECTFKPDIDTNISFIVPIEKRSALWKKELEDKIRKKKDEISFRQKENCTFIPNSNIKMNQKSLNKSFQNSCYKDRSSLYSKNPSPKNSISSSKSNSKLTNQNSYEKKYLMNLYRNSESNQSFYEDERNKLHENIRNINLIL